MTILSVVLMAGVAVGGQQPASAVVPQEVSFPSGSVTLRGTVYKPAGDGPFPALIYNHGSAPGSLSDLAFEQLGLLFVERGWVFFAPYRRGQGLSAAAGPYVADEIASVAWAAARRKLLVVLIVSLGTIIAVCLLLRGRGRWIRASFALSLGLISTVTFVIIGMNARHSATMQVLQTSHLPDHLTAYRWLEGQKFVDAARIATAGNSFGGIITVLAAKQVPFCAAVDVAGGAHTWSAPVAAGMKEAVRQSQAPIFFFQAANDYTVEPTQQLGDEMRKSRLAFEARIYPPFGSSKADGHSFAWRGSAVWADDVFRFLDANCK